MDLFPAQESRFISKPDIGFRLDQWYPEKGHNILLVTGHSGSGKTTLAKKLAQKPHTHCIELDWFDWFRRSRHPENPDWVMFTECFSDLSTIDPQDIDRVRRISIFEEGWQEFKRQCAKTPDEKYVVEGIQVITMMPKGAPNGMARDPKTMPILIKGTSAFTSVNRARKRSQYPQGYLEMLVDWMGYDKRNRRFMADLLATGYPQEPEKVMNYE